MRERGAGVDRVGPAPVFLRRHDQVRMLRAFVDRGDFPRLDLLASLFVDAAEAEMLLQRGDGAVGRSVVHHDDLVRRVVQFEHVLHRVHDDGFLVVGRHDDRDRHGEVRFGDTVEFREGDGTLVTADLSRSEENEQEVNEMQGNEVNKNAPKQNIDDGHHACASRGSDAPCSSRI